MYYLCGFSLNITENLRPHVQLVLGNHFSRRKVAVMNPTTHPRPVLRFSVGGYVDMSHHSNVCLHSMHSDICTFITEKCVTLHAKKLIYSQIHAVNSEITSVFKFSFLKLRAFVPMSVCYDC